MTICNPVLIRDMHESCVTELSALSGRDQLSSYNNVNQLLAKSLLLSCASFYEEELVGVVRRLVATGSFEPAVLQFLEKSAIEGQFFKWFNFRSAKNTNAFLSLFGTEFKNKMRKVIDAKEWRKSAEQSFLELCIKRNESVHRNYAAYSLDLSVEDIHHKHKSAMSYLRIIEYGVIKWLTRR